MNILYISNLSNHFDSGLNWSVPASVKAQGKIDNVLWIDLSKNSFLKHWSEVEGYHNIKEFGKRISLNILPKPFQSPDIVVFEGFYYIEHVFFAQELVKKKIPYIIVPRSNLTSKAQKNGGWLKFLKKRIAHLLFFDNYIKYSASIQYLTRSEQNESTDRFHHKSFVLPNGFDAPVKTKTEFSNAIKAIFVGRLAIYQKGLDLLLEVIRRNKQLLEENQFSLRIYGPPKFDYKQVEELINKYNIGDIVIYEEKGITGEEKVSKLLDADLFVLTSRFEGHPMSLIEALSYGLPCLVTSGTNMCDEICEYDAGWGSDTSIEGIEKSLLKMVKDKKCFLSKSHNARSLSQCYNWDLIAEKFHHEIVELLSLNN